MGRLFSQPEQILIPRKHEVRGMNSSRMVYQYNLIQSEEDFFLSVERNNSSHYIWTTTALKDTWIRIVQTVNVSFKENKIDALVLPFKDFLKPESY